MVNHTLAPAVGMGLKLKCGSDSTGQSGKVCRHLPFQLMMKIRRKTVMTGTNLFIMGLIVMNLLLMLVLMIPTISMTVT